MVICEDDLMHCPFACEIRLRVVPWPCWEVSGGPGRVLAAKNHKADLNYSEQLFAWSFVSR